jgi:acyl carrier protein
MTSAHATATRLLARALMITEDKVPGDARLGKIEQWDSLAHARLLLALEENLGRMLTTDEAVAIETLDDIERLVAAKL